MKPITLHNHTTGIPNNKPETNLKPIPFLLCNLAESNADNTCAIILLTPELLGYCGFKHEFGDWYLNAEADGIDDGLPFLRYKQQYHTWYHKENELPLQPIYLHQLQEVYRTLLKKELPINAHLYEIARKQSSRA